MWSMAANAVLDTYELLEHIITYLHPFDIARCLRVTKAWYTVVKRSARIRRARVLAPIQKFSHVTPTYNYASGVRFHSSLEEPNTNMRYCCSFSLDFDYQKIRIEKIKKFIHEQELLAVKRHFATRPPCEALNIRFDQFDTTVYVKGGVRIGDILDVALALMRQKHHRDGLWIRLKEKRHPVRYEQSLSYTEFFSI